MSPSVRRPAPSSRLGLPGIVAGLYLTISVQAMLSPLHAPARQLGAQWAGGIAEQTGALWLGALAWDELPLLALVFVLACMAFSLLFENRGRRGINLVSLAIGWGAVSVVAYRFWLSQCPSEQCGKWAVRALL